MKYKLKGKSKRKIIDFIERLDYDCKINSFAMAQSDENYELEFDCDMDKESVFEVLKEYYWLDYLMWQTLQTIELYTGERIINGTLFYEIERLTEKRKLIYEENDEGFCATVVFETNCPLSVKELSKMSHESTWARRSGVSFSLFKDILELYGYEAVELERLSKIQKGNTLEIVTGAIGKFW